MPRTPHPLSHIPLQHLKDVHKFLQDTFAPGGDYLPRYDGDEDFTRLCHEASGARKVVDALESAVFRIDAENSRNTPLDS